MCGRFANGLTYAEFIEALGELLPQTAETEYVNSLQDYLPTYNVAPQTCYPVMYGRPGRNSAIRLDTMRWGIPMKELVPSQQDSHLVINSRDDTILQPKSIWRDLLRTRRCILFCQGYYEWQKVHFQGMAPGQSKRIAHFVGMTKTGKGRKTMDGQTRQLVPLAGLWTTIPSKAGNRLIQVFTIITTQASKQLSFLHARMPVILSDQESIQTWLGINEAASESFESITRLLKPYCCPLDCYKVPQEVGRVGNSNENMIYPLSARKDNIKVMLQHVQAKREPSFSSTVKRESTNDCTSSQQVKDTRYPQTPRKRIKSASPSPAKLQYASKNTPTLHSFWS